MSTNEMRRLPRNNLLKSLQYLNDIYVVSGLVLIGLLLRLPSLRLGLWRDEAYTYFDALPVHLGEVFNRITYTEFNPPGFYLIMNQWIQWFGAGEISLKLPPLLFGVLLIPATYLLGRVVSSRGTGVAAAAITTFAPASVYYSQEVRTYTLAALLCCCTVTAYCQALTRKSHPGYLAGFVVCATLLLHVHYAGFLVLGSLAMLTLVHWWYRVEPVRLLRFVLAFGIIFLLFTPWLQSFFVQLQTGTPYDVQQIWWKRPLVFLDNIFFYSYSPLYRPKGYYKLLQIVLAGLAVFALGMGTFQIFSKSRESPPQWSIFLNPSVAIVGACFVLYTAMLAALSRHGRYMFPIAPLAWVLYGSWLLALFQYVKNHWIGSHSQVMRRVAFGVFIGLLIALHVPHVLLGSVEKSGVKSLAADLGRQLPEKTFYLVSPDYLAATFGYYFAQYLVRFYGFARWERPEIWTAQGYAALWDNPTVVAETIQRIRDEAQKDYQRLAVIFENAKSSGQMNYSRGQELLSSLKQTYPLLEKKEYPGRIESVTLYIFSLTPHNNPAATF